MSKKENIALLLTPSVFWDERPAMTGFMENEVQEGINTAFNLINAECGNLPYKVLEYNAPHLDNPETILPDNDLKRNDYELDQFRQAIITQTQYTLNMGNDFSQGSSTLSTGGMSATIQRPEKRDIIAPGVLKFLQNARLYQLQVYASATQKQTSSDCNQLGRLLTIDTGDTRYVKTYQENAQQGQVAFINSNKQVSFANPSELSFNVLRAKEILDRDGEYRQIKDIKNLAWFGEQGSDAMDRDETIETAKAYRVYDDNFTYMNEDIVWTWNESTRYVDTWKSKQDNNKGHNPKLDTTNTWWEKLCNRDIKAKYIYDPVNEVYKTINQFDVHYFGGLTKQEIYAAIIASGTTWNPELPYGKGFVVIFVDSNNTLNWYENLQDRNIGHNPETSPEWWKKLPTQAIDVNDVVNQVKPYVEQIVGESIDKKLDTLKTALTTDYAGTEFYFNDEGAFDEFLANNPKLQREWFDDIPTQPGDYDAIKAQIETNKQNIQTLQNSKADKSEIPSLGNYYTKQQVYNKSEIEQFYYDKEYIKTNIYGKSQVDALLNSRLENYYTKLESDDRYASKTSLSNYYTKSESNSLYPYKSALSNYYTKAESDNAFLRAGNLVRTVQFPLINCSWLGGGRLGGRWDIWQFPNNLTNINKYNIFYMYITTSANGYYIIRQDSNAPSRFIIKRIDSDDSSLTPENTSIRAYYIVG